VTRALARTVSQAIAKGRPSDEPRNPEYIAAQRMVDNIRKAAAEEVRQARDVGARSERLRVADWLCEVPCRKEVREKLAWLAGELRAGRVPSRVEEENPEDPCIKLASAQGDA
jgi:hypothetical protein